MKRLNLLVVFQAVFLMQAVSACRVGFDSFYQIEPESSGCSPWTDSFTFTEPERLDVLNSPSSETEISLTADSRSIYFSSTRGTSFDIYHAWRPDRDSPFGEPEPVDELNTDGNELRLVFTEDELDAFANANWPGSQGNSDIFAAHRESRQDPLGLSDFASLQRVNSDLFDYDPFITPDGLRLYFYRRGDLDAPDPDPNLVLSERFSRDEDFSSPVPIPVINTDDVSDNPSLTRDELMIVFSSVRPNQNGGGYDIWYAVRDSPDVDFSEPVPVPVVNTSHFENEPYVSLDGCELFFSSDRPDGQGSTDLYRSRILPNR